VEENSPKGPESTLAEENVPATGILREVRRHAIHEPRTGNHRKGTSWERTTQKTSLKPS
jgi:hypothetical protein